MQAALSTVYFSNKQPFLQFISPTSSPFYSLFLQQAALSTVYFSNKQPFLQFISPPTPSCCVMTHSRLIQCAKEAEVMFTSESAAPEENATITGVLNIPTNQIITPFLYRTHGFFMTLLSSPRKGSNFNFAIFLSIKVK